MLESFNSLSDYRPTLKQENVRGRRLALATTALRSPPLHRRHALKANLLTFVERLEFRGGPELWMVVFFRSACGRKRTSAAFIMNYNVFKSITMTGTGAPNVSSISEVFVYLPR